MLQYVDLNWPLKKKSGAPAPPEPNEVGVN